MYTWFDNSDLVSGTFIASIKVHCRPRSCLNLRPIITTSGEIVEWQLMISTPSLDYKAVVNGEKPAPGSPVVTPTVIRFHPDDIEVAVDVQKDLSELRTKYEERRYESNDSMRAC